MSLMLGSRLEVPQAEVVTHRLGHTISTTSTNTTTSLRFGTTGHIYRSPAGQNVSTSGYELVYNIQSAYRGSSICITHNVTPLVIKTYGIEEFMRFT